MRSYSLNKKNPRFTFYDLGGTRGPDPYLMAVFALARPKYSVVQQIQRVVEVGPLKAVAVQYLQGVENPPDSEPW